MRAPPASTSRKKAAAEHRKDIQTQINHEANKWWKSTNQWAQQMSLQYGKPVSYFTSALFTYGSKKKNMRKPSAYNAFLSKKADELEKGDAIASSHSS